MRILSSLVALVAALSIAACSSGSSSSSSSDQTGSAATSSATDNGATSSSDNTTTTTSTTNSGGSASTDSIPSYPGAKTEAAGNTSGMGSMKSAAGKVMSTSDSFDKVYAWYQKNMPAGSEKSHTDAPVKSAVFTIGDTGSSQQSVTITVSGGKTMITVASVKM